MRPLEAAVSEWQGRCESKRNETVRELGQHALTEQVGLLIDVA